MSGGINESPEMCASPLDPTQLALYWLGELVDPEEKDIEEHLFACDECGERLREIIALAEGVRDLARRGSLRMVLSESVLARAAADGLRIRQYQPPVGGSISCTVSVEDELLIARLAADFTGATRVDLAWYDPQGEERFRLRDIPVAPRAGAVLYQEQIEYAKQAPTSTLCARLLAINEHGLERLVGEYTFNHKRTIV